MYVVLDSEIVPRHVAHCRRELRFPIIYHRDSEIARSYHRDSEIARSYHRDSEIAPTQYPLHI